MPRIVRRQRKGIGNDSAGIIVMDEGLQVGDSIHTLNFVGQSIKVFEGQGGIAYITSPEEGLSSHFGLQNGESDARLEFYNMNIQSRYIGLPTEEGNPYYTGGFGGSVDHATNSPVLNIRTIEPVSALRDSKFLVEVISLNGDVLSAFETPIINGNTSGNSDNGDISFSITNYAADIFKTKGIASFSINHKNILADAGFQSGKFDLRITHIVADGTGSHTFLLSDSDYINDFFYDGSSVSPSVSGDILVSQVASQTKHLSGIEYYTTGSSIQVDFSGLNDYNRDTALITSGVQVDGYDTYGVSTRFLSPIDGYPGSGEFSGWNSSYDLQNVSYSNSFDIDRLNFYFAGDGIFRVGVLDSWSATPNNHYSSPRKILIDTSTQQSTNMSEYFNFENKRTDENFEAWDSASLLRDNITVATCGISIFDNDSIVPNSFFRLFYTNTDYIEINFGNNVSIGQSEEETVVNIVDYININHSDVFTASASIYSSASIIVSTVGLGPDCNISNTSNISSFILHVSDFEGGSNDGMLYFGKLIDPSVSRLSDGTLNTNWSQYEPNIGGVNPDYTGKSGAVSFYRVFSDVSGLSRTSMSLSFIGTFVSNATDDLQNGDLKIFIRKVGSDTMGGIFGKDAPVMRLHGPMFGEIGTFDQGITVPGSYIREDSSLGNEVMATFGTYKCTGGVYIEVMICNPVIQIERMDIVFY